MMLVKDNMQKAVLPYASITFEYPIVHIIFEKEVDLGFPEIKELTRVAEELAGYKPYVVLSEVKANVNVTPEGKRLTTDRKEITLARGTAVLVDNSIYMMAMNFYSNFTSPPFPFKAFTDKQKAIAWLRSLPLDQGPSL
ncbi:MAG TPA: hypothetical protein VI112_16740 [Bacteroidia bacterium]|jgi:hypothetical protein